MTDTAIRTLPCGDRVRGDKCPIHDDPHYVPGHSDRLVSTADGSGVRATPIVVANPVATYERIMGMRYGVPKMTLQAIGETFDPPLSRERIRQIIARGRPAGPNGRPPGS